MVLLKKIADITRYINNEKASGKTIGFVATMGALHMGHLSLIDTSKKKTDITVCSIFVNPTQFNDAKDFEKYPVTIEQDILLLEQHETDVLFLPSVNEMYPEGPTLKQAYKLGDIEHILEGAFRPGHFQGVCQIVDRLFTIIQPNMVFFGQKDYQQCMVIANLIELKHPDIKMHIRTTLREQNGLAMSSRNTRLNDTQKQQALGMFKALQHINANAYNQEIFSLKSQANQILNETGFEKIDYVEVCDAQNLQPIKQWNEAAKVVVVGAAFLGGVRLIDNIIIE